MKLYVAVSPEAREALAELARVERRHPSDQAALLLERALRRGRAVPLRSVDVESIHRSPALTA